MNILSIFLLVISLVSSASFAENKHHARPCNRCGKDEAITKALSLQSLIQNLARQCDFKSALELSLPDASFSTIDMFCADNSCCNDKGSMEKWWTYYQCTDTTYFPVQPRRIEYLKNGTVIITLPDIAATYDPDWRRSLDAYEERWFWMPVESADGCDFRLGYIDGHAYNCPAFIPNISSCEDPICISLP